LPDRTCLVAGGRRLGDGHRLRRGGRGPRVRRARGAGEYQGKEEFSHGSIIARKAELVKNDSFQTGNMFGSEPSAFAPWLFPRITIQQQPSSRNMLLKVQ
jgi:hypothetical protein